MILNVNNYLRNRARVLNHLPLLDYKETVLQKLGIVDNDPFFRENIKALADVHNGLFSPYKFISQLSRQKNLSVDEVKNAVLSCYPTGLLEFHLTDVCDLKCINCHYRSKNDKTFPYSEIADHIRTLYPRAVTITGGGEPNVYMDQGRTMNDAVCLLADEFPDIQLGLINNNTHIPAGDWQKHIQWQRSSVDAATRETYLRIKGQDKFDACLRNVKTLLKSPISFVGVGFLYRKENIEELAQFLLMCYALWKKLLPEEAEKFNVQLRPISPPIDQADHFDPSDMEVRMREQFRLVDRYRREDALFAGFLSSNTNYIYILSMKYLFSHDPVHFTKCKNALLHRVLRSDGTQYPDFLLCDYQEKSLGNYLANPCEAELLRITLSTFYYYHCCDEFCNPQHCRQGWVSCLIDEFRSSGKAVSDTHIPPSYFF